MKATQSNNSSTGNKLKNMFLNMNATGYSSSVVNPDSTRQATNTQLSSPKGGTSIKMRQSDGFKMTTSSFKLGSKNITTYPDGQKLQVEGKNNATESGMGQGIFSKDNKIGTSQQKKKRKLLGDKSKKMTSLAMDDSFEIVQGTNQLRLKTPVDEI